MNDLSTEVKEILDSESIWNEDENSIWKTNVKPKCDLCGKKSEKVFEICIDEDIENSIRACFSERQCWNKCLKKIYQLTNEDFVWVRLIEFQKTKKSFQKRIPVGLAKRYKILKRDRFQCVLCGNSGEKARLEIDHIIPESRDGSDDEENLQTLCFMCNRGKRDSL